LLARRIFEVTSAIFIAIHAIFESTEDRTSSVQKNFIEPGISRAYDTQVLIDIHPPYRISVIARLDDDCGWPMRLRLMAFYDSRLFAYGVLSQMNAIEISDTLLAAFNSLDGRQFESLDRSTGLEDLGLDSLGMNQILLYLEERLGGTLSDEALERMAESVTVGDLLDALVEHCTAS
jgi:acyl carrier protein